MSSGSFSDFVKDERPKHRPLEEISGEIDSIDRQIQQLEKSKSRLILEHDEAIEASMPIVM